MKHRYLLVGIGNTLLDLALFSLLAVPLGVPPVVANVVSTVVVMTISFFLNRSFVFRAESAGVSAYAGFVAVTLFSGLLLQSLIILGVLQVVDWPVAAKVVAMGCGMVSNFLGYRWVFSRRSATASSSTTTASP